MNSPLREDVWAGQAVSGSVYAGRAVVHLLIVGCVWTVVIMGKFGLGGTELWTIQYSQAVGGAFIECICFRLILESIRRMLQLQNSNP